MLSSVHNKARETGVILLGAMMNDIPYGYCQCGCGELAPLATHNEKEKGWVKGEPLRYIPPHGYRRRTWEQFVEHFWSQVDKRSVDECWLWQGGCSSQEKGRNYGQTTYHRKHIRTHVLAYELAYGAIPAGLKVLHRCDNPPCCNPNHLFLGTDRDNALDKVAKGRHAKSFSNTKNFPRGSENHNSKLTELQVIQIKKLIRAGKPLSEIARTFEVYGTTIASIRDEKTWKHVRIEAHVP